MSTILERSTSDANPPRLSLHSVAWNVLKFLTPGLADAAAAIHPWKSAQMAEASSSRNAPMTQAAGQTSPRKAALGAVVPGSGKTIGDGSEVGGAEEDVGGANDGDGQLTEDGASAPTAEDEDEAQLAVLAGLPLSSPLTVDDVQAGRYPGLAGIKRLEREYKQAHPQVSAVGDARVWEEGDNDQTRLRRPALGYSAVDTFGSDESIAHLMELVPKVAEHTGVRRPVVLRWTQDGREKQQVETVLANHNPI
ncbi:hypothetical protein B0H14DRAFT_3882970 [Mycena olivaceomarginata]|nr:hypothetical protein B0H14DRAFT_3882970 [Mycena olivaceomarginata]